MLACHCQAKPWEKCRFKILVVDKTILIWSNCLHEGGLDNCLRVIQSSLGNSTMWSLQRFLWTCKNIIFEIQFIYSKKCNLMKGHAYLFLPKFTKWLLFHFTIKNGLHQREILSPVFSPKSFPVVPGVDNWMGDHHCGCQACKVVHQSCVSPL